MSGPRRPPRRLKRNTMTPSQLMRLMGNSKGNFDTIPPDCYQYAMDPEFKLAQTARRLHAWEMWRTIGNKAGGPSPQCADHRGDLNLVHAHDDLGVPLARIIAAQEELESAGLSRRDGQGRIYPAGSIPHKRRRTDEGEEQEKEEGSLWKTICTELFSTEGALYFQSLSKNQRAQWEPDVKALWQWGERIKAEALGTAREAQQAAGDMYLRRIGYSGGEEKRGAPRKERTAVQLKLIELPQLSVEFPLCTEFGGIPNTKKNGNVQNGASLLPSHDLPHNLYEGSHNGGGNVENGSNVLPEGKKVAAKSTPRSNPSFTKNLPVEDLDAAGVVRTVEGLIGRRLNADDPLREKFAAAPRTLDVPASIVCKFLLQHPERRDPEDLYALINTELPVWIRHHVPQVDAARRADFDPTTYNAQLRALKQESQT